MKTKTRSLRMLARMSAVIALCAVGLLTHVEAKASSVTFATCEPTTLSLCDFTPAANGQTLAMATFEVVTSGLVSVFFSRVDYGEALLEMTLQIVLPSGPVTALLNDAGMLEFEGVAGQRYSALIYLLPGESNFGLANLLVTQAPVPLPPAAVLLVSALAAGWRFARRRQPAC